MADQNGQPPPSPYPPMSAPGGTAPLPRTTSQSEPREAASASACGVPGAPSQPAPKKSRFGLIIGIIVAVILVVGLAVIGIQALTARSPEQATTALAEQHFDAAMKDVEDASASLKIASSGPQTEVSAVVTDATKKLLAGRDEIVRATADVEQLKDSPGRTDYLSSLRAATVTLDALQEMVAYMDTANGMAAKAKQAADLANAANISLNNAVSAGNSNKYSAMRSDAISASKNYTKAAALFREAHALDVTAGLDKAAVYADNRKLEADVVARMAQEGKAKKVSAYNSDIKKQAALGKQAEAAGTPAIVSDPNWAQDRLASLGNKIDAAAKQADDLRAKALKELGVTQ
jgi:hypothetical protein